MTTVAEEATESTTVSGGGIEVRGIGKSFPGVIANHDVNITIRAGHHPRPRRRERRRQVDADEDPLRRAEARRGHHRASTARRCTFSSPTDAIKAGIGMVFQHFMLADNLTVLENVVLGAEKLHGIGDRARAEITRISDAYGFGLDPDDAGRGPRRRRAAARRDPQGALPRRPDHHPRRADRGAGAAGGRRAVRQPARAQAPRATPILFISHKLDEVLAIADDITVMRRGTTVGDGRPEDGHHAPARRADGRLRAAVARAPRSPRSPTRCCSSSRDVSLVNDARPRTCSTTSTSRSTRARCSASPASRATARPSWSRRSWACCKGDRARSTLNDSRHVAAGRTRERREAGIGFIPEDRHRHGLLLDAPLWENRMLGHQTRQPCEQGGADRPHAAPATTPSASSSEYDVRTPGDRHHRPGAVRRQPAEAHRRPRDERRPDPADRRAPDPRRRRRRPGRDLGPHQAGPARGARRAADLRRPRRADRPVRPDRGHPARSSWSASSTPQTVTPQELGSAMTGGKESGMNRARVAARSCRRCSRRSSP